MSEWRTAKIKDLGIIFDGPHATPTRTNEGPLFLNISSLVDGRLALEHSDRVSEADFAAWTRRVTPEEGDLLFSYETRLGDAALMPADVRACLGRRMAIVRPDRSVVDPRFLLYAYRSPAMSEQIQAKAIRGATVDRIPLNRFGDWSLRVPHLNEQRAIAEVLGALDDKIAANMRTSQKATAAANSIFLQHLNAAPKSVTTYAAIATVGGGGTPRSDIEEYWAGDIPWATPTDVTALTGTVLDSTSRRISELGLTNCASPLYGAGSILMTSRATIGKFAIAGRPLAVNQGFIVVNAKDERYQTWLFHEMQSRVVDYLSLANGATFLELSRGRFKSMTLDLPEPEVAASFADEVRALDQHQRALGIESGALRTLRDALLPALMSGALRVKDAERAVEDVL